MPRRWKIFVLVAFLALVADQATKIWARSALPVVAIRGGLEAGKCTLPDDVVNHLCMGKAVSVIPDYWDWRLSFNPGSAFGLFHSQSGARVFLSLVGIIAVGAMLRMVRKAR